MAEVAAGVVAYEVVETTAQLGVGAYWIAQPTAPLKATFTQIATSSDDQTRLSLARSGHTLSIVGKKAYIYGGETASGKLASNEVHSVTFESESGNTGPDYSVQAIADNKASKVPAARKDHSACTLNQTIAIFGGVDESGHMIKEASTIWLYNTANWTWEAFEAADSNKTPIPRSNAHLFEYGGNLVLCGGQDDTKTPLKDTWHFDCTTKSWTQLADAPVSTPNVAFSDGILYAISGTDNVGGNVSFLRLAATSNEEQGWQTVSFPTNPFAPGPLPRTGAGLTPVTTGYGRQYLLYFFGTQVTNTEQAIDPAKAVQDPETQAKSDMWTFQLPSSNLEAKPKLSFSEAIKPAKIKDAIRTALGADSGKHSWAEVEILPPTELDESSGKIHPGPRSAFAYDVTKNCVVMWGGVNPKGEREGDGWMIKLE